MFLKNNLAVSHVVGYMLTITIIALFVTSMIITTTIIVSEKKEDTAKKKAQAVLDQITNSIIECATIKQLYPSANYVKNIEIPTAIVDQSYYVEFSDEYVYLNTTNGKISLKSSNYNLGNLNIGIGGKVPSSTGVIKIYCNSTNYVNRFDFGTSVSPLYVLEKYTKATDSCYPAGPDNPPWPSEYKGFLYRMPFYLFNPNTEEPCDQLSDFQIRLQLNPQVFNYDHVRIDGADIRFYEYVRYPL